MTAVLVGSILVTSIVIIGGEAAIVLLLLLGLLLLLLLLDSRRAVALLKVLLVVSRLLLHPRRFIVAELWMSVDMRRWHHDGQPLRFEIQRGAQLIILCL